MCLYPTCYYGKLATLESRAEAHIAVVVDVGAVEEAVVEGRGPSAVRTVLRRRPVAVREANV